MQKRANRITFRNHWYVQVFDQTISEHIRFILTGTGMNYINSSRRVYLNIEKKSMKYHWCCLIWVALLLPLFSFF